MIRLLSRSLIALALLLPIAGTAQTMPRTGAPIASPTPAAAPRTILFVGNSFTFGAHSPVERFRPQTVTDLNGDGFGGVPALFKAFTAAMGEDWRVSLETVPGAGLDLHWTEKRALIDRPWDVVVLQGYSTLDRERPGNPDTHIRYARMLGEMMKAANPRVRVELVSTWTRADQVWKPEGHWFDKPVGRMAEDLQRASIKAMRGSRAIDGVVSVGLAWNRAFETGLADPNPYDGLEAGRIDLWTWDQYHASAAGYYLEALMVFGKVTGIDPRRLTREETAGRDLGLSPDHIAALQAIAQETLARDGRMR
jgi:hypothetical protein